jgi:tetratricopeptide (TPR) repeat protein
MRKTAVFVIVLLVMSSLAGQKPIHAQGNRASEDSARYYVQKGKKLEQQKRFAEALNSYLKSREFLPANDDAILGQIKMNFNLTRLDEGFRVLDEWVKLEPDNPVAWKNRMMYNAVGANEEKALESVEQLTRLEPDSAEHWMTKAQILWDLNRNEEAMESSGKATLLAPRSKDVWIIHAYACSKNNHFEEGLAACNKVIALAPDDQESFYTRACIYSLKGDKGSSLSDLKRVIDADPSFKKRAQEDLDFRSLYNDKDFKEVTFVEGEGEKHEAASADSVCSIPKKNYKAEDYTTRISGSWVAIRAYVHGSNALGSRKFLFRFNPDGSIIISEPARNWNKTGKWKAGALENTLEWELPEKDNSLVGSYDFLGDHLIISGDGFIGSHEHVCLRLKKQ